jgi:methyl-accepting chemotaxis protein
MTTVLQKSGEAQVSIAEGSVEVLARMQTTAAAAEEAINQLRKVEPPPLKLAQRLDKVTGSLEGVGGQLSGLSEGVRKLTDEGAAATTKLAESVEKLRQLADEDRRLHNESIERVRNATEEVTAALQKVGVSLQADVEVLKTMEEQSKQSAALVAESHRAANEVLGALTNSARAVTSAIREQVEG